jgi:signal transduction histidine kinase
MNPDELFRRYQELQQYVGWTEEDGERVQALAPLFDPHLHALIDDFYVEIQRHPAALQVITGGQPQIERLKGTLRAWLRELLHGPYDRDYVARRWRVGWRHVDIGLDQVYTNVALSRLRQGLLKIHEQSCQGDAREALAARASLNMLLDLDLAIIEDAYQTEYLARQQRSERLATIGQVAAGVAHELRNPLNVVKTSVYYLLNARQPTAAKTAEHLQRIEKHVVLADNVITTLSNFAKMPLPNLQPFSLETCLRAAVEDNPCPGNIQVDFVMPPTLPPALADPDQIAIVFANLIRNARDAMPNGGQLTLQATAMEGAVLVYVKDTGVGIAPELLHRIMEPLYSTKARGLGLGLAMARAILEKNKGAMSVHSEVGKGSVFTVRLLAAHAQSEE